MVTQNIPISLLPVATALDGSEQVPVVQGGVTKRSTTANIASQATGFVPTSRAINTAAGLTGGGTLATDLNLSLDILHLVDKAIPVAADSVAINNSVTGLPQSTTIRNFFKSIISLPNLPAASANNDYFVIYRSADGLPYNITAAELTMLAGNVPTGGTTGQPLIKVSNLDYNSVWATLPVIGGGTGTITNTNHGILLGQGGSAIAATAAMSGGQLLIGQAAADPAPQTVSGDVTISNLGVTAIGANKVTDAMLRQGAALSVIGRSAATIGNVTDIVGAANQVLRVNGAGTALGFGSLDISQAATVGASVLLQTNGGTGFNTYLLGDTIYASAANTLSKLAGNITTGIKYLSQTGSGAASAAPAWTTISGGDITGAALTKTDDTNVTLTLGGTPATALLRATSLALGWTGQLSLARGGTNASLTASNGGIFYSTASAGAVLAGTATAQQMLQSGATAAPAWSTAIWPATTAAGTLLTSATANTVTASATPTLGIAGSVVGQISFANLTSGTVSLAPVTGALGSSVLSLPAATDTLVARNTTDTLTNKTLVSPLITGSAIFSGDVAFKSGRPWADITGYASLVVATDWTAAIYAAMSAVSALGGGVVYFPPGLYATFAGIDTTGYTNITFLGAGIQATGLWTANRDVCALKINGFLTEVAHMTIFGKGSNADTGTFGASSTSNTVEIATASVGTLIHHCYIWNGYYPLKIYADDVRLNFVLARGGYGPANLYVRNCAGVRVSDSSVDQGFPVQAVTLIPPGGIPAWLATHGYVVGDIVSLSGYVIQCSTAGTSGGGAPALKNYGVNITDGSVVWTLARPLVFYGVNLDTGASEFLCTKLDVSGTYESCVKFSNTLAGTAPFLCKFDECILSGSDIFGVDIAAGGRFIFADTHIYGTLRLDISAGIRVAAGTPGANMAHGCHILSHLNGILDSCGAGNIWADNHISVCGGNAIYVGPNVNNFGIVGNDLSVSNARAYTIDVGTGDYFNITGNNTGTQTCINAATGTHWYAPTQGQTGTGAPVLQIAPTITGGVHTAITTLGLRNAGTGAFDLNPAMSGTMTGNRALSFDVFDASRVIAMRGNISLDGNFVTSGLFNTTLTVTGATALTLPTSGTLAVATNQNFTTPSTGANGGTNGSLKFFGSTSGDVTVKSAAVAGTATNFQLPATNGTSGYHLQTDGSGNTSWATIRGAFSGATGGTNGAFSLAQNTTGYTGPSGSASNSTAAQSLIALGGTFKNLCFEVVSPGSAPGGAQTYTFTLRIDGVDTALTCTMTGASITASDLTHSVTINARQKWDIKMVSSATAVTGAYFAWSVEFDNP